MDLKETGRRGIYLFLQLYTLDPIEESSLQTVCSFTSCQTRSLFMLKKCYRGKHSRVHSYCRGRHVLVYVAIPRIAVLFMK